LASLGKIGRNLGKSD